MRSCGKNRLTQRPQRSTAIALREGLATSAPWTHDYKAASLLKYQNCISRTQNVVNTKWLSELLNERMN